MKLLMLLAPLALTACVTDRQAMTYVCSHQISVRLSAETALKAAVAIKDPVARQAAIDGANATLRLVEGCGPVA